MNEIYEMVCDDCGNKVPIVSPATLSCQKCGCGTHTFKQTMIFECFYGHKHVGKKSNPLCSECLNVERTMWRKFRPSQQIGDEENRMPETKKVESKVVEPKKARKKKVVKTKSGIKKRKKSS